MKRLLSVLCLFVMWVAPANGEQFDGTWTGKFTEFPSEIREHCAFSKNKTLTFRILKGVLTADFVDMRNKKFGLSGEIDKKDIKYLEKQANIWGKTLVDKNLLTKLKDFDFWKEWKNK